ncbi:type II CAAX prenyl endopeptidase Rce1 family protein [Flaviramulus sp. BrNp1-15]|uniref:CPBP family glutamic-type intramembrane protease n=1 Tax=Flaviramulus sp. BrNp1-15 TaxID=2916754 RepID=UPI00351C6F19
MNKAFRLLKKIFLYIKKPHYERAVAIPNIYKIRLFTLIFTTYFIVNLLVIFIIENLNNNVNIFYLSDNYKIEAFKHFSKRANLILLLILLPITEELFFRGPISLFKKNKNNFKNVFHLSAISYGFAYAIFYQLTTNIIVFSVVLIMLSKTIYGLFLGLIRVRFGIKYSIISNIIYSILFYLTYHYILLLFFTNYI